MENESLAANPNTAPAAEDLRSETGKARVERVPDNLEDKQAKRPTRFVAWMLMAVGVSILVFMLFAFL